MAKRKQNLPEGFFPARIEGPDHEGRGVARLEEKVVFIDGALAGEEVLFRYTRRRGRFDEGEVVEVLRPSPDRVTPRCPHFGLCGGCSMQHVAPEAQVRHKQDRLLEQLDRLGRVQPQALLEPITGPVWGYRHKARIGAKYVPKKGRLLVGFRERRSRFLADLSRCEVLHPALGEHLDDLRLVLDSLAVGRQVPQVELAAGEDATALVFRHLEPLGDQDHEKLARFAQGFGFRIYLQSGGPDTVRPLDPADPPDLGYRLGDFGLEIRFRPTDFTQVNPAINRRMVNRALELLEPAPGDRILDLFCGLGNFTLPLARRAGQVTGVEGEAGLVERARANARRNRIGNVAFHVADLNHPDPEASWLREPVDGLLLDPPRSGALGVVRVLRAPYPRRVVYVSCDIATLARDAGELVHQQGYRLTRAGVMDMFPHTAHAESMAVFEQPT